MLGRAYGMDLPESGGNIVAVSFQQGDMRQVPLGDTELLR